MKALSECVETFLMNMIDANNLSHVIKSESKWMAGPEETIAKTIIAALLPVHSVLKPGGR